MSTIQLPIQMRAAEMRAETFNEESRTVDLIFSTGARVRRYSWDGPFDEELSMDKSAVDLSRLNSGAAPLLNSHDSYELSSIIGVVLKGSARIESGKGMATVKLSAAPEHVSIVGNIKDGIIRSVSVGYAINEVKKTERDDGEIPLWFVTRWQPMEVSAVAIPADAGAVMRSGRNGASLFPCSFIDQTNSAGAAMARMRMREREIGLRV